MQSFAGGLEATERGVQSALGAALVLWIACLLIAPAAAGAPLDLSDTTPRWVAVAFEISPAEHPARRRAHFTPRLPARLEPGMRPGEIRIRVAGPLVEQFLLPGHDPTPGSFGDFLWTFDGNTGHVVSAQLAGSVRKQVGWGFTAWSAEARIRVRMSTRAPVAFETAEFMGEAIHGLCEHPPRPSCTRVDPSTLDPRSGYVNAVGWLSIDSGPIRIDSFSPLGEAIFSEVETNNAAFWTHGLGSIPGADVSAAPPGTSARKR